MFGFYGNLDYLHRSKLLDPSGFCMKKNRIIGLLVLSLFIGTGFVAIDYYEISKNLDIFGKIYKEIHLQYVDEPDPEQLIRVGIDAMLASLDPYTEFISEEEYDQVEYLNTGQYAGIGVQIARQGQKIVVTDIYSQQPADKSGVKIGDQLLEVDGTTVTDDIDIEAVRTLLRGDKGSEVRIGIRRQGESKTIPVVRDRVKIPNVAYSGLLAPQIGYIALTGFTFGASKEVQEALLALKAKDKLQGLVLDLRGNPGGRLDEAIQVVNLFIPQKEKVVEIKGRIEGMNKVYYAEVPPLDAKLPLVILIDGRSASASEIVAGAVQDLDRGVVIGKRSFGKGLVQNIRPLAYNTQLKLTTAKYYTPSGRCIQALQYVQGKASPIPDSMVHVFQTKNGRKVYDNGGIHPDIAVTPSGDEKFLAELVQSGILYDFVGEYVSGHPTLPAVEKFEVDPALYTQLLSFANERSFQYRTPLIDQVDRLKSSLEKEGYLPELKEAFQKIEAQLRQNNQTSWNDNKNLVSAALEEEIVRRYYGLPGKLEESFDDDPNIREALKVIGDIASYKKILSTKP